MRILVVYGGGGLTGEAEVSVASGTAVAEAARANSFTVSTFELSGDNVDELSAKAKEVDVVFSALHGHFGEDGQIQKLLDEAGVKYVGSGVDASRLCWDKLVYKQKLHKAGILTPNWWVLERSEDLNKLTPPCVIKPIDEGSSLDMLIARSNSDLDLKSIEQLLQKHQRLLVEDYIDGIEISAGVLGDKALPVIEIIPPTGRWFDYQAKYSGESREVVPPENASEELQQKAQTLALQIHQLMGCRHLSRTDMIIANGDIYVLETNTLPGMTPQSLYPKEAKAAGLDMSELVKQLIELAVGSA
ncbi:D-alanine--D-alanine ligase [Patescibacteria group bacterium]|nr:D-alanine--D-alanine ligase [Patescibacteria group bacterium]